MRFSRAEKLLEEVHHPTEIVGYVAPCIAAMGCLLQDERFNAAIDRKTGYRTQSILCMPLKDSRGDVIGVAQAINKIGARDEPFNKHDEKVGRRTVFDCLPEYSKSFGNFDLFTGCLVIVDLIIYGIHRLSTVCTPGVKFHRNYTTI